MREGGREVRDMLMPPIPTTGTGSTLSVPLVELNGEEKNSLTGYEPCINLWLLCPRTPSFCTLTHTMCSSTRHPRLLPITWCRARWASYSAGKKVYPTLARLPALHAPLAVPNRKKLSRFCQAASPLGSNSLAMRGKELISLGI